MLACLFDFAVGFVPLVILLIFAHVGFSVYLIWTPVLLLTMIFMATGIGMIVSAAGLFFRDVKYIVEVLLTFGIFFTPVFFEIGMFGSRGKWLLLNPVSPLLEGLAACMTHHQPPNLHWFSYSLVFSLVALVGGHMLFKRLEPAFAESI